MGDSPQDLRAEVLAHFSEVLGAPEIDRITQRGEDPETARYTLHLHDGRQIRVGTIKVLWSQTELGRVLAVTCRIVPRPVKASDWRDVLAGVVANAIDLEEVTGEAREEIVREWVARYADGATRDRHSAAAQGAPFVEDGRLYVAASELAKYVRREHHEQIKAAELRRTLCDIGFERRTVHYTRGGGRDGRRSTISYYVIDASQLEPPEQ